MVDSDYYMDPDLPEAEPLWHMSQSMDHRPLLAHPVITSFLCLKWRRIRPYFYANLFLYSLFLVCLTSYLLMMTLDKVPSIYHVITLRVQKCPKCPKVSRNVQKCPKMSKNVKKISTNVQKSPKITGNVKKMCLHNIWMAPLGKFGNHRPPFDSFGIVNCTDFARSIPSEF